MNNDLEQFSEERLKKISSSAFYYAGCEVNEIQALARIALSVKQAKPVINIGFKDGWPIPELAAVIQGSEKLTDGFHDLYTTPQPAHTEVNTPVIPDGWKLVPIEMTDIMKKAYYDSSLAPISKLSVTGYRALIAAAPKPEIK